MDLARRPTVLVFVLTSLLVIALGIADHLAQLPEGLRGTYTAGQGSSTSEIRQTTDLQPSTASIRAAWNGNPPETFSAAWNGSMLILSEGSYTLGTVSDDGSSVVVDGRRVVDNGGLHGARLATGRVHLTRGVHSIAVEYFQGGGSLDLDLVWSRAGERSHTIPSWVFTPRRPSFPRLFAAVAVRRSLAAADWLWFAALLALTGPMAARRVPSLYAAARRIAARRDVVAFAIVLLALAFRLYRIDAPFVDAHSWRQVINADIARIWAEGPIDFFYPSVSWGGPDGRVGLEFPLLHLLMAMAWRAVGTSDVAGRLVPVAFSLATVWLTYLLGSRLFGRPAGRAAAFLMAVSPSVVYFGRTPLSDTPMLCFSVGAVLGYAAYAGSGRRVHAVLGAASLALAGLVKLPGVLVLGPVLWTGIVAKGLSRTLRDPWYVAAPLASLGAIGLWYFHADQVYLETGLTQAIFRPSGSYPPDIARWAGVFTTVSHWTRPEQLTWETLSELMFRYWRLHLTWVFSAATMVGILTRGWSSRARSVVDVWTLASGAFVLVSLAGQIPHAFHQLPMLPPLALYFGMAAGPLFGGELYTSIRGAWRPAAAVGVAAVMIGVALYGFADSGVVPQYYRPATMNLEVIDAGLAIDRVTPPHALMATIEYDRYGSNSPMVLYFAHRKGWSFDAGSISPGVITYLRDRRGVCYVAIADWPTLETLRPDVVEYLRHYRRVALPHTHSSCQIFDLGCGALSR